MMDIVARAMAAKALSNKNINQYSTKKDFPKQGEVNIIYIDENNNTLYYWNSNINDYVNLNISPDNVAVSEETVVTVLQKEVLDGGIF